jgi:hypothetical protein
MKEYFVSFVFQFVPAGHAERFTDPQFDNDVVVYGDILSKKDFKTFQDFVSTKVTGKWNETDVLVFKILSYKEL